MYPIQVQYCNLQCFLYVSVKICYKWTFPNVGCIFDQFFVRILSFMASAFSQHLSILTAFFFHCPWNKINTKSKSKNFKKRQKTKNTKNNSQRLLAAPLHIITKSKKRKTEKQKTQKHSQRLLAGPSIHKTSVFCFFAFIEVFLGSRVDPSIHKTSVFFYLFCLLCGPRIPKTFGFFQCSPKFFYFTVWTLSHPQNIWKMSSDLTLSSHSKWSSRHDTTKMDISERASSETNFLTMSNHCTCIHVTISARPCSLDVCLHCSLL